MNRENYSFEVLVNGRPVSEHPHQNRVFIEGREGTEYTLKLRNNSCKRILAVFSVDGIEVIKGKVAAEFDGGYVINAYDSMEVKGYRIDETAVAGFKFTNTNRSYSNLVGAATVNPVTKEVEYQKDIKNNGVIGVRVFVEDVQGYNYSDYKPSTVSEYSHTAFLCSGSSWNAGGITGCAGVSYASSAVADMAGNEILMVDRQNVYQFGKVTSCSTSLNSSPNFNLGTTWGKQMADKVKEVEFKKSSSYIDLEIYYASKESLLSYGIEFDKTKQYVSWPKAFEEKKKFCKVPDWYK